MEILKKIKFNSAFLLFIFCYSLLTVGSTYAFLEFEDTNSTVSGVGGCSGVNYTGEEITGASLSGGTSYTEGSSSIVTLSKDEDCTIYTIAHIKIHTNESTTAPITSNQALRYKVEKISGDGEILSGGEGFINQIGEMTLATVTLTENVTTYKVYIWLDVTLTDGLYNDKTYSGYIFAESVQTSTIAPDTAPDTPVITRVDYDTFTYSATDNVATTGYYVSNSNVAPTESSNWSTTRTYDIGGVGTYYVWARDINGNISEAASISAYTVTRSVGTGSNLVTRYDSISEDTGTEFTSNLVVLEGTPIYVEAINNSGYASPTLTSTGGTVTNGSSVSITGDTTFTSSATSGNYSIKDSEGNIIDYAVKLADAVNLASAGNTITLLNNYSDDSTVTFNKNLTLDIPNGLTLTRTNTSTSIMVNSGVTLTKIGTGTLTSSVKTIFSVTGNLTIEEGTVSCTGTNGGCNAVAGISGSLVTINGGTVTTATDGSSAVLSSCYNGGTTSTGIIINGGTVRGAVAANAYGPCYLKITGGNVSSTYSYALQTVADQTGVNTATITISGGVIDNTGSSAGTIYHRSSGKVNITGGTITCGDASNCINNISDGGVDIKGATVTSADTVIYNSGTGTLRIGDTTQNGSVSTTIKGTGSSNATIYCGSNTGSQAECYIYSGSTITSTAGYAILNNSGDYRQYAGTKVQCSSTSYRCIYNGGTTLSNTYYGRIYIRRGYVESVHNAIYSTVQSNNAVALGNQTEDAIYNWATYQADSSKVDVYKGPMVRASDSTNGIGINIAASGYYWLWYNGLVGGANKASNKSASTVRSGKTSTAHNGSTYKYISLD